MNVGMICQRCAKKWCWYCNLEYHEGISCHTKIKATGVFADQALDKMPQCAIQCPKCKIVYNELPNLKSYGCMDRKCAACGHEWCVECRSSTKNCWHQCGLTKYACFLFSKIVPYNPVLYLFGLIFLPMTLWIVFMMIGFMRF